MRFTIFALIVFALGACGAADPTMTSGASSAVDDRLDAIQARVDEWAAAGTIEEAAAAAEAAANLVVGPDGLDYGDRDGDGDVGGAADAGLVPDLVVAEYDSAACVETDVLGGSWDDPDARWAELATAIDEWSPTNNTFPTLASHPMRIVGWATLTIGTDDLDEAHEYAGHAQLHVDVSRRAVEEC